MQAVKTAIGIAPVGETIADLTITSNAIAKKHAATAEREVIYIQYIFNMHDQDLSLFIASFRKTN